MSGSGVARGLLVGLVTTSLIVAACGRKEESAPAQAAAPAQTASAAAAPAAAAPAPAITQASWAPDAIEELVAPIALYPDALLGQVLAASVNAQEVLDAGNWLLQNQDLKGDELDAAAVKAGFGPATRALVQFPTVVDMMCREIDWTRQLGSAFTSDQKAVLDAVQRLRTRAADAGNLKSTPEQNVEKKTEGDKVVVEVKPADPKIVYVPQYDPQAAYTQPAAAQPAPATSSSSTVSTGAAIAGGVLAFGVGVILGKALDDDDYCYPHWGAGAVYVGPRPFYPPAYVYRPVYGPGFHPAYRYVPPAGYRYAYDNVNVNVNRNVVVSNNNYFNRFTNNRNLQVDTPRNELRAADQRRDEVRAGDQRRDDSWRGQSTYAGARDAPRAAQHVDRGYGSSTREAPAARESAARQAGTRTAQPAERPIARAPEAKELRRDRDQETRMAREAPDLTKGRVSPEDSMGSGGAFANARREGAGSFERASSARGRASLGSRDVRSSRLR